MYFSKDGIIERKLRQLKRFIPDDVLLIPQWSSRSAIYLGGSDYGPVTADEKPFCIGDTWECYDNFTRWFAAEITVPQHLAGKTLALELEFGGEGIVRANGHILSSITSYLEPQGATRTRVLLAQRAQAGARYRVEIEAHTNYMEFNRYRMQGQERIRYTIRTAQLVTLNAAVESYCFDIQTALDAMRTLQNPAEALMKGVTKVPADILHFFESISKDNYYYEKLADALVSSLACVDFDFDREATLASIPRAAATLQQKISAIGGHAHGVIKFVGQAHIDTAWLWPVHESIRKTAQTFSNVCALMDKYPEFTFAFSQPQLFAFCKEHYPELYDRIKEKVHTGQFELVGNTWVEMDTNIPSGESLIRQILYGRQYFIEEFGKCSDVFWMPDVFGYSWALPQIIKRSGMKYFFTSKLINNDDNRFPYSLFQWQGIDGTRVPAYLQRLNYNGVVSPQTLHTLYQRYDQKAVLDEALMTFGFGDGGGGPNYQMLETARRLENFPGLPKLEMSTAQSFFEDTDAVFTDLPVWNDEMYYEFHRGTYTSQAETKKNNRKSELLYRQAEMASIFACSETGIPYPSDALLTGYKKLLTNQFHDIIPGSSIHAVYQDTKESYAEIMRIGDTILTAATEAVTENIAHTGDSVAVFNFLCWERNEPVSISLEKTPLAHERSIVVRSSDGRLMRSTLRENILTFYAEGVPPMGYALFTLSPGETGPYETVHVSKNSMENCFYKILLDENANLTSIVDKRCGREVLSAPSNLLKLFEDKPERETAWNIDLEYQNREWVLNQAHSIEVLEQSAVRGVLRIKRTFGHSSICQDIILHASSDRIDFETQIDWQETEKMLKAEFSVDILSTRAAYEIQFGTIERPTHSNTPYDRTKFEVCAHKWADLSEGNYGVSLLNDCKYGYDIKENRMRITLLRASTDPDPTADKGTHRFVYALRPHAGGWVKANAARAGYELNVPLYPRFLSGAASGRLPAKKAYFTCAQDNVVLDTIKRAEDGRGIIIRLYESCGSKTTAAVTSALPFQYAAECNLMEQEERELPVLENGISFTIKPYEIKTFKLY